MSCCLICKAACPRRATRSTGCWTSYIVAAAIITPATGWLEARFGRKPLFLTSVIGFIVTSMLCGTAVSLGQMVVFRLLQGIFGAPLVPLSQSVLLDAYPPERQGQATAVFGLGMRADPRPDTRRLAHRLVQLALGVLRQLAILACYALSVSCCFSDGAPIGPWPEDWTGSVSRRSRLASEHCSSSSTVASGSTDSPHVRSRSRPPYVCSASTSSRSAPCRRAIRSSIPHCSVIGISLSWCGGCLVAIKIRQGRLQKRKIAGCRVGGFDVDQGRIAGCH